MNQFYSNGLRFSCQKCGYCCGHEPGFVFLSHIDLEEIPAFLKTTPGDFLKEFCKPVDWGFESRISLMEKANNDCIFWNENGCSIYKVRPLQCRTYPFWPQIMYDEDEWGKESKSCPGIHKGDLVSGEKIRELLKEREELLLLSADIYPEDQEADL